MKLLELNLNKRLLIVEPPELGFTEEKVIIALGGAERYIGDLTNVERELKFICKGSDLTEDIAKGFIPIDEKEARVKYPKAFLISYKRFQNAFIDVIESAGYHWGENPVSLEREKLYREICDTFKADGILRVWQESESRTFNPEKCIIFEIL